MQKQNKKHGKNKGKIKQGKIQLSLHEQIQLSSDQCVNYVCGCGHIEGLPESDNPKQNQSLLESSIGGHHTVLKTTVKLTQPIVRGNLYQSKTIDWLWVGNIHWDPFGIKADDWLKSDNKHREREKGRESDRERRPGSTVSFRQARICLESVDRSFPWFC